MRRILVTVSVLALLVAAVGCKKDSGTTGGGNTGTEPPTNTEGQPIEPSGTGGTGGSTGMPIDGE